MNLTTKSIILKKLALFLAFVLLIAFVPPTVFFAGLNTETDTATHEYWSALGVDTVVFDYPGNSDIEWSDSTTGSGITPPPSKHYQIIQSHPL